MKYDVIIVGAGPGGIFAAYELMQQKPDLKVAVFEAGHALAKRNCPIDGDKITGLKVYSEFESEQAAKDADSKPEIEEAMKSGNYKDHKVQGKFIIVTMNDSMYQGLTVDQLKMTAEALEKAIQSGTDAQSQQQTEQTEQTEQKEQSTEQTEKNTEESTEATEESEE